MRELTQSNINTMMACRYCPMCRHACPSGLISYRESDTPRGRAILLYNVYKGGKEFDQTTIQAVYNCFLSGDCKSWCEGQETGGYDIPELILFARRDIVNRGLAPKEVLLIKDALIKYSNTKALDRELAYTNSISEKTSEVLYLLGETIDYSNHEIAKSFTKILDRLKVSYTLLKNEPTSGKELEMLGYDKEAQEAAKIMAKRIESTGCKTIVVSEPLVYDVLKNSYPVWGIELKADIFHVSEYLQKFISSGILKLMQTQTRVTIADSEYLGRFNKVYEAPREIIKSSVADNFVEMQWHHELMQSAGEAALIFDGKLFDRGTELGRKISQKAEEISADTIVTLSAKAKINISETTDIIVNDIAEWVEKCMY